jgi:uncharacterized coiled-coil DUF342 family protein
MDPRVQTIKDELNDRKIELMKVDLEVASTFAMIAEDSRNDAVKRTRNRANARRGYDTIIHFMETAILTKADRNTLTKNLGRLKSTLVRLGEEFPQ